MGTRKPETCERWTEEALYIEARDPERPGPGFNNDPACFVRYVAMQARFARQDGFAALSDRMLAVVGKRAIPSVEVPADLAKWHHDPSDDFGILHHYTPDGQGCSYREATDRPSTIHFLLSVGSRDDQSVFTISVNGWTRDETAFDPDEVREALWKAAEGIGLVRRKESTKPDSAG